MVQRSGVLIETYWNVKKETKVIDKSSIKATVTFAPGYKKDQRKWEKGKIIQVSVTADVHGFTQWFQKPKTVRANYMIENGGSGS